METALKACSRAYSVLLILYPGELRERFADEMLEVFEQQIYGAWEERGFAGVVQVWLWALAEVLFVALPTQMGQPIVIVPTLSLLSNSVMFLALLRTLSPLADLCRAYRR